MFLNMQAESCFNPNKVRRELIVLDLIERMTLPQDIRVRRNGTIVYTGSITRIPKELLNEKVISIYTNDYSGYFYISIE